MISHAQSFVVGLYICDVVAMLYSADLSPQNRYVRAFGMNSSLSAIFNTCSSSRTEAASWKMEFSVMNWIPVSS